MFLHSVFSRVIPQHLITVLFLAAICLVFGSETHAARQNYRPEVALTQPVTLTAPTINKIPPATFDAPFSVSNIVGDGVISFQFNVQYNPSVVRPTGIGSDGSVAGCSTSGTFAQNLSPVCSTEPDPSAPGMYILRVAATGSNPISGSGTLLNVNFQTDANAHAGDTTTLNLSDIFFFSINTGPMTTAPPVNGRITLIAPATMSFASVTAVEDESQTAQVAISRTGDTSNSSTVTFATIAGGTATGGASCNGTVDYVTEPGQTVTFASGATTAFGTVQLCRDLNVDNGETVKLQISGAAPSPAQLGAMTQATLTINDTANQYLAVTPISLPNGANGSPYASTINVTGAATVKSGLRVTLFDVDMDTPANLDALLVSPTGQQIVLVADAGGSPGNGPATLTFSDSAGQVVPNAGGFVTGNYEATSWEPVLSFGPPAPPAPYNEPGHTVGGTPSLASVFGITNPNGVWTLYTRNDAGQPFTAVNNAINGGWGIQFFPPTAAGVSVGGWVLTSAGTPIRNASVSMRSPTGETLMTVANAFGYYRFAEVPSGSAYLLTATARGTTFPTRLVNVVDTLTDENIVANR